MNKLDYLINYAQIKKCLNGARLTDITLSEDMNVLPTGSLHKNKHADFGLEVTKKGIPVITVEDDNVSTLEEILELGDTLTQHAEVEAAEVIFNKLLTDYVEEKRKEWHKSGKKDNDICLEVGMRICKELLENTKDEANIISDLSE